MSRDVYFNQHCPVCGRMLEVRVSLLGKRVYCQHCGGGFVASDEPQVSDGRRQEWRVADRAEQLLERAALMLARAGAADAE